jgi:hypothetical protein
MHDTKKWFVSGVKLIFFSLIWFVNETQTCMNSKIGSLKSKKSTNYNSWNLLTMDDYFSQCSQRFWSK